MSLEVQGPFDLQATIRLLQRRPNNRIDVWSAGRYRRVFVIGGRTFACAVANRGTIDSPRLQLETESSAARVVLGKLEQLLRRILGLDVRPGFSLPGVRSRPLAALARALRGARPPRFPTLFESFARIVPYQQVSLEAGGVLVSRFVERFGTEVDTADGPVRAFPSAETVADAPAGTSQSLA